MNKQVLIVGGGTAGGLAAGYRAKRLRAPKILKMNTEMNLPF